MLRESPGFVLAVNQFPIDLYVEDAPGPLNQFGLDAVLLLDRGRQTGGLRQVVSLHTVFDADLHSVCSEFPVGNKPTPELYYPRRLRTRGQIDLHRLARPGRVGSDRPWC